MCTLRKFVGTNKEKRCGGNKSPTCAYGWAGGVHAGIASTMLAGRFIANAEGIACNYYKSPSQTGRVWLGLVAVSHCLGDL